MEAGKLTHSHSQPGGMDRTPPGTPKKGGKMLAVRVQMLDDTITMFQVQAKALGRVLFEQVCNQLHLLESDYFGLEYQEVGGTKYWLDLEKPLCRQIGLSLVDTLVRFCVKFYTPDPSQLEEEFTRYLFCLQIKRDLSQGLLQCNSNTAALLASYIVQAECGDYVVEDYPDHRYLSSYKFVPNQEQELERKIMENHKKHAGQSPAEADLNLLETARRCELYGIKMHPAKDHEGLPLNLAVAHMGIVVFHNFTKISTFSWAKIRKISFKRKRFLIKLHPEGYGHYKDDTVEFFFEGRNECKNFWKKCVENHGFFRCTMVKKVPRQKTRVLSRGSSFRYSGRTQKQIVDFVRENYVKRQTFQRSQSFRHSSSAHSSVANVGTSISAHPLLPLGDNAVAGTPASLSCGSMTLTSSPLHTADIHAGGSPSPPLTTSVSPGTSVTSSPQHFYPQETPYRRAGLQPTKMKRPHVRSHRAISPLQSPTDAATAANNRSANLSNTNLVKDGSDVKSSRASLRSPDYANFNDVYSNCYSSLRSSRNNVDNKTIDEETKTDIFDLPDDFANASSKSNESIRPLSKRLMVCNEDVDRYTWHRSASCKDLYHEENVVVESPKEKNLDKNVETDFDFPVPRFENSRRKCYSAVASKNTSVDRTGDVIMNMKIYSSSYPGTTSSLSTESPEGDPEDRAVEIIDVKYNSQEEMALSHDDVSHDSYELLERELYEYTDELSRVENRRPISESERARSCSWGSDRGMSPMDSRSTENVVSSVYGRAQETSFWSPLEKESSPKHKSEMDFRSLNYKSCNGKGFKTAYAKEKFEEKPERRERSREFSDYENRCAKRAKEDRDEFFVMTNRHHLDNRMYSAKPFGDFYRRDFEPRLKDLQGESFDIFERKKHQSRGKSLEELFIFPEDSVKGPSFRIEERRVERKREKRDKDERFHEGIKEKEQKEWEREKERRQMERRINAEGKARYIENESSRKMLPDEYHLGKKFDGGKYVDFPSQDEMYESLAQERKIIENYEKICQVGRLAKELKETERSLLLNREFQKVLPEVPLEMICGTNGHEISPLKQSELGQFQEPQEKIKSSKISPKPGKALVERTKSDPYNACKNQKRNILMHQKSIDLTPQQSEETASDYDNEDALKKTSRSEHDIPYILHKRHCMNGTARNSDFNFSKGDIKSLTGRKPAQKDVKKITEEKSLEGQKTPKQKHSKGSEGIKLDVQIINLDSKNDGGVVSVVEPKKVPKKPLAVAKKPTPLDSKASSPRNVVPKKSDSPKPVKPEKSLKDEADHKKSAKVVNAKGSEKSVEPIYAEVCKEKITNVDDSALNVPPEPPKRTSFVATPDADEKSPAKILPRPPKRTTSIQKPIPQPEADVTKSKKEPEQKAQQKPQRPQPRGKAELPVTMSVLQRREESLILFARTCLGLSEGSAFAPITRQGRVGSPASQRRTKSLDAPYVSVHSLPPVDSFSSKDDTVDEYEGDIMAPASKAKDLFKDDFKKSSDLKTNSALDTTVSTESEMDSVFTDHLEPEDNFKKTVESQSKLELAFPEEKVLDSVRNKRLLSKIESVDMIDSEGDMDSSKLADPPAIPSDRLVNLPESIRFPSVRQISGQTSEESADGWDQREVKVKRRTPRRSVGREDPGSGVKESVVWDSKDDEPPDDDVWDDTLVFTRKGSSTADSVVPVEYLKRGSCGQSIDDDNLSTPMKESSPEHWVSVDDLPEAIEREEKLLRQQEKILREKILNEKLKRELNLDTIDVDERYYEYKDNFKLQKSEEDLSALKDKFKGHSLDTYELNEKKLRERGAVKNSSLDEHLLGDKPIKSYSISPSVDLQETSSYENVIKASDYPGEIDYIQCKVVNDVTEIDQFGDNDEELEEFFVVLDENLGNEKEKRDIWENGDTFKRSASKEESLISVPEEFKDVEKEEGKQELAGQLAGGKLVEIRLSQVEEKGKRWTEEEVEEEEQENLAEFQLLRNKLDLVAASSGAPEIPEDKPGSGRLTPRSRRDSEEHLKLSSDDTGRLSPYDCSSRRSSEDPRRLSSSEDAGRLSPFNDSRRGSEDPRRLSTSEDSRKYSMSESVSEETRRRLSSTEETRRKRASLTKQCSVGADSLSDELISGIQECSSSFEHDEKDVFEAEPPAVKAPAETTKTETFDSKEFDIQSVELPKVKHLEIEVSEDLSSTKEGVELNEASVEINGTTHLAPPTSERELSRETEDSVDYGEGDFKDIRDVVKEKDISEGLICDNEGLPEPRNPKPPSSFEKSESSEGDELCFIDEKRGSTPEIIVGKSKEALAMSIVVVNEGISVLNKISENGRWSSPPSKAQSLPREMFVTNDADNGNSNDQRHTLPKKGAKPQPLTPKPDFVHKKLAKAVPNIVRDASFSLVKESLKSSLDSSQESDIDKLGDFSLISHVQSQIARRNLSDAGKSLSRDEVCTSETSGRIPLENERKTSSEEEALGFGHRTSSEEREKTESSSFELKSSAEELGPEDGKWRGAKGDKMFGLKTSLKSSKTKKDAGGLVAKEKRSPDQEKRDSGEDGSSSSSAPVQPKRELSSTWKPFLLESSGSSSLEEGWLPPDDNAHLADEEETSSTSNNQQDDSCHDDIDYPTGIGYPVLGMPNAEMMVSGYGSVYALSRTLSRISERSTSEQERSDVEDDITKPSSHSVSAEEESIMSSDHQPSLSSDPPSPRESSSRIPDLPDDRPSIEGFAIPEDRKAVCEPFDDVIPPPVPDDDWPSPPSSSSVVGTPLVSHIETFYIEIHPEEACKVVVAEPHNEDENSSSDDNRTLHEESEFFHLSSDNVSLSTTTTTTQDGTVIVPVRPRSVRTGSISEDTSMISTSEWSTSATVKPRSNSSYDTVDDLSEWLMKSSAQDSASKTCFKHSNDDISDSQKAYYIRDEGPCRTLPEGPPTSAKYYSESYSEDVHKPKVPPKIKPPKLISPTTKNIGFFETPVSKVRSPTSQSRFFEAGDRGSSVLWSPTSRSETTSPKTSTRFFETSQPSSSTDSHDSRLPKGKHSAARRESKSVYYNTCTPYYSNVADSAEKSYFGRYDTGSLERTKIHSSRKCFSYYSVSRTTPHEADHDGSNSEGPPPPSSNTIPRASKKTKKRHRVAMDLEIRDGKIVAPPKTKTTVIDNSVSGPSSPRGHPFKGGSKRQSDV